MCASAPATAAAHLLIYPQVRTKLPCDGNAAAFFKVVGELAVHAGDLSRARDLFAEAAPIFRQVRRLRPCRTSGSAEGAVLQC